MAFNGFSRKTWTDRVSEYPTRRILTDTTSQATQQVTVSRDEGTVTSQGDTFDAETMNNLEARIASSFTEDEAAIGNLTNLTTTEKSNLVGALNEVKASKADIQDPEFIGNPKAPTQTAGNNSTSLATTAFVQSAKNTGFSNPSQFTAVNVTSRTSPFTDLGSFTLSKGTWLVIATINFASNASGYRAGIISSTSGASSANYTSTAICGAAPSDVTRMQIVSILQPSSDTTYYVEAKQNSGSTLSCAARVMYIKLSN